MFKLIAFVFLAVNGVAPAEPTVGYTAHQRFSTQELCMNYFDTPDGVTAKVQLESGLPEGSKVEYKCLKTEEETL
jgi:hypothetical protein